MTPPPAPRKRTVEGVLVKLLTHRRVERGMTLAPFATRCLRRGEIHELVTSDQAGAELGDRVDRVGFVGFAEIVAGGVVERGDLLVVGGRPVGTVLGFDECHLPNHYNVLVGSDRLETAATLGLGLECGVRFEPATPAPEVDSAGAAIDSASPAGAASA